MRAQYTLHKGFTLIELMATLAVLGIFASIAIPSFQGLLVRERTSAAANELLAGIQQARSEAVKMGRNSTLCPRNPANLESCGTNWSDGWVVRVDRTANASGVQTTVRSTGPVSAGVTIGSTASGTPPQIQFRPLGQTTGVVTFTLVHNNPSVTRRVCVYASGQSRILPDSASNC